MSEHGTSRRTYGIRDCPRCGETHEAIEFKEFEKPFAPSEAAPIVWRWWGTCPRTLDPILMAVRP